MARTLSRISFAVLILCAHAAAGQRRSTPVASYEPPVVTADLDGDHKPDLVRGRHNGFIYTVEIEFSTRIPSARLSVPFAGLGALLLVCDLNRDSAPDVLVQSPADPLPAAVWLGDGEGHFRAVDPWRCKPQSLSGPSGFSRQEDNNQQAANSLDRRPSVQALASADFPTSAAARGRLSSSPVTLHLSHNCASNLNPRSPPPPV